jgi:L-threonylcarbamoyladenylate synthase
MAGGIAPPAKNVPIAVPARRPGRDPRMLRLSVDPHAPEPDVMALAAQVIGRGGLVALPTDTLYGLAVNPFDALAVARVFQAKGRAPAQALPLIAADQVQVGRTLGVLTPKAAALADRFWPGPLTLLVPAPTALAPAVAAGTGRVGVRVPAHAVARALCLACGSPLTATSANMSGEPGSNDPEVVSRELGNDIDLLLDAGLTPGGQPSTIVDVTGPAPVLVRAGAIGWKEVQTWLDRE